MIYHAYYDHKSPIQQKQGKHTFFHVMFNSCAPLFSFNTRSYSSFCRYYVTAHMTGRKLKTTDNIHHVHHTIHWTCIIMFILHSTCESIERQGQGASLSTTLPCFIVISQKCSHQVLKVFKISNIKIYRISPNKRTGHEDRKQTLILV